MRWIFALASVLTACGPRAAPTPPTGRPSVAALEASCRGGEAKACVDLGLRYTDGDGVDMDRARARPLFARGCELHDDTGCAMRALHEAGEIIEGNPARLDENAVLATLDATCGRGIRYGCRGAGMLQYDGPAKSVERAAASWKRGCDIEDGTSCGLLALVYLNEQGDTDKARETALRGCKLEGSFACFVASRLVKDNAETRRLLDRACELGDPESCYIIGQDETGPAAVKHFDRACTKGHVAACVGFGRAVLDNDRRVAEDDARAIKALAKACDKGLPAGCSQLGLAYHVGRGVQRDEARGIALLAKSCEAPGSTDTVGCEGLAVVYLAGKGVAKDPAKAADYARIACERKNGAACAFLADLYAQGTGVTKDLDKAGALLYEACELDHVPSCTNPLRKAP